MNREIKFRAWSTIHRFMATQGTEDIESLASFAHHYMWNGPAIEAGTLILMQYTGLKDKNGVEIYEGDIITYYGKLDAMTFGTQKQAVRWDEHRCGFFPMTQWYSQRDDGVEVIGNIYENAELLR